MSFLLDNLHILFYNIKKIYTSRSNWLEEALRCYRDKVPFEFIDDGGFGLTEHDLESALTLIKGVREKSLFTWRDIARILTGLGLSGTGVWLILIAIADPEPTSKLWILLAGGVVLLLTGGVSLLHTFGQKWRVGIQAGGASIVVEPGNSDNNEE